MKNVKNIDGTMFSLLNIVDTIVCIGWVQIRYTFGFIDIRFIDHLYNCNFIFVSLYKTLCAH